MSLFSLFFKRIRISYGITVCNEAEELRRLLDLILREKGKRDEVIVLQDVTIEDQAVNDIISSYGDKIVLRKALLNKDFSSFKNSLIEVATGDYLFQLDADEIPQHTLLHKIKGLLRKKYKYDCFLIPRINRVNGITDNHLEKWKWMMDTEDRINFPDYQTRLFKLNGKIKWMNAVHEELVGFERKYHLSIKDDTFCLLHIKSIDKQIIQNDFYKELS